MGIRYLGLPLARPPTVRHARVCHVGTLDPAEKGAFSWEAHGLSVSLHPEAWQAIAKLGGRPWHLFERKDAVAGLFLDYWALGRRARRRIARWGVVNGLVCRRLVHARRWWDDELEDTMIALHDTRADALDETDGDDPDMVSRVVTYPPTAELERRIGMSAAALDAFDALLVCYVEEEHPDLDGVWWADRRGPLSAPRGCIAPPRLSHWSHRQLEPATVERLLLGNHLTPAGP